MLKINIKINFTGGFSTDLKKREITLNIENDIYKINRKIGEIIQDKKGNKTNYVLLVNGISYSLNKKDRHIEQLKDGDILTVVPVVAGG